MIRSLGDYYRIPDLLLKAPTEFLPTGGAGFFSIGDTVAGYGHCESSVARYPEDAQTVALKQSDCNSPFLLPFDADEVIENLVRERYVDGLPSDENRFVGYGWIRGLYYLVREALPVSVRRYLQRIYFSDWKTRRFPAWPLDTTVDTLHEKLLCLSMAASGIDRVPFIWFWPAGASSCLIMTHDVETATGRDFTGALMDIDDCFSIKSSFQVIPEKRYEVTADYIQTIKGRGFEVNVHDFNHDGHLYEERAEFLRRAEAINGYVRKYDTRGFRAGAMYRRLDWYDSFEFSYDMSVPNVAHLEPQRGGCCTVMPYFVGNILELPLTTAQDYSIFHIINDLSLNLWKDQIDRILDRNGLISFITHPDYLIERRYQEVYKSLLNFVRELIPSENIWATLPREVDRWWRGRSETRLVKSGSGWTLEGPEKDRACIAYAVLEGNHLRYEFTDTTLGGRA